MRVSLRLAQQLNRSQTIGFIGLGAMGSHMSANLLNATFSQTQGVWTPTSKTPKPAFVIYDPHLPSLDKFLHEHTLAYAGRDIIPASSPAGVARLASTIITMLPSSPEVEQVYLGENGILEMIHEVSNGGKERDETLLIDCTTGDIEVGRMVASVFARLGVEMVDAPVSGGVVGAQKGTLSFMVGGTDEGFEKARPVLERMGKKIVHCGDSGNGLAAKICNNLLLGISMAGTAEAMLLGQALGLSPSLLASILNSSTGKCWSSESNNPAPGATPGVGTPADRGYTGGFLSKLMAKDLNLAIQASKSSATPLPITGMASSLYNALAGHEEFSGKDFSVVFDYLKQAREGGLKGKN